MPGVRIGEQPLRDAYDVAPQRFPLVVLTPDIRPLEQRNDQPLRLHEHHLWRTDLSLHTRGRPLHSTAQTNTTYRPCALTEPSWTPGYPMSRSSLGSKASP